ncbi:GntR family transcriptional regulator [Tessaracoccus coleopterorum]|uniref:GntR family transcriptional regulator n=1 Tax=Tessaracoccus coleopterorum TaxID=2714950 RepID=UPI002F91A556
MAARVSDDIVAGVLAEGDQVPSINEFASFWRINPATALKGIAQLVSDGVLYKQRGIGTFVADGPGSVCWSGAVPTSPNASSLRCWLRPTGSA